MTSNLNTQVSAATAAEMTVPNLRELFSRLPNLSAEVVDALCEVARTVDYADGELILEEGEHSDHLLLVASGQVVVFRAAHMRQEEQRVITLGRGELLGEMALIDGAPRSLSARAEGGCRLLLVRPEELARLPDGKHLLTSLRAGLGASVVQRVRGLTDNYVKVLERKLETIREQQQFGQFFLYVLGVLSMGALVSNVVARRMVNINVFSLEFVYIYLFIMVVPSIVILLKMKMPLRHLGMTKEGLVPSLKEGIVLSAATVALTNVAIYLGLLPGGHFVYEFAPIATYAVSSFLQELFARGFFLASFQRFLGDERGIKSVLASSFGFGFLHLHFGMGAVAVTTLGGLIFGTFYLRHKNLAGVTVLHFFVGACAFGSGLIK